MSSRGNGQAEDDDLPVRPSSRAVAARCMMRHGSTEAPSATLAQVLNDLHNTFDVLKSEIAISESHKDDSSIKKKTNPFCDETTSDIDTTAANTHSSSLEKEEISSGGRGGGMLQQHEVWKAHLAAQEEHTKRWREKYEAMASMEQEREASIIVLKERVAALSNHGAAIEAENKTLRTHVQEERKQVIVLTERLARLQKEVQTTNAMITDWTSWMGVVETQVASLEKNRTALEETVAAQRAELESLRVRLATAQETCNELAICRSQSDALTTELRSMWSAQALFDSTFCEAKTAVECGRQSLSEMLSTNADLVAQLSAAESKTRELESVILQLTASTTCAVGEASRDAAAVEEKDVAVDDDNSDVTPKLAHESGSGHDDDAAEARMCHHVINRCAILEAKVVELTLHLSQSAEEASSLRLELEAVREHLVAPLTTRIVAEQSASQDSAVFTQRWDELHRLVSIFEMFALKPCEEWTRGLIQQGSGGDKEVSISALPNMLQYHQATQELVEANRAQASVLAALESELQLLRGSRHQTMSSSATGSRLYGPQSTAEAGSITTAATTIPTAAAVPSTRGRGEACMPLRPNERGCGVCGWAVSDGSSDFCRCRLCGECYHKPCCRQEETLFVCHKHESCVGSASLRRQTPGHANSISTVQHVASSSSGSASLPVAGVARGSRGSKGQRLWQQQQRQHD